MRRRALLGRAGISLVELLIVIVIIGLLATTITLSVSDIMTEADADADSLKLATWNVAVDRYMWEVDQGQFPPSFRAIIDARLVGRDADSSGLALDVTNERVVLGNP